MSRRTTARQPGVVMSYAVRLANRDYERHQIVEALMSDEEVLRLQQSAGAAKARRFAETTAEKALAFVRTNPAIRDRQAALIRILELEAFADALPWGLYGGPGPRRALEAMFVVAENLGGVEFGLALRQHAEIAGQSFERIRTHRASLDSLGWIRRNPRDRPGKTSRFALRRPSHIQPLPPRGLNVGHREDRAWMPHDAFREDALGDEGWYVLSLIFAPTSLRELASRSGFDEDALEAIVGPLVRGGVVDLDDAGRCFRVEAVLPRLDDLADRCGTAGQAKADRARHRRDREEFRGRQDLNVGVGAGAGAGAA